MPTTRLCRTGIDDNQDIFLNTLEDVQDFGKSIARYTDHEIEAVISIRITGDINDPETETATIDSVDIPSILSRLRCLQKCTLHDVHITRNLPTQISQLTRLSLFDVHFSAEIDVIDFLASFPALQSLSMHYVTSAGLLQKAKSLTAPIQYLAHSSHRPHYTELYPAVRSHDHILRWILLNPSRPPPVQSFHVWDIDNSTALLVQEVADILSATLEDKRFHVRRGQQHAYDHLIITMGRKDLAYRIVEWQS